MAVDVERQRYFTSLSQEYYLSEEILEEELARVFNRQWLYVGHTSELPAPGDLIVREAADESLILTRGQDGEIHALFNVCRHRGSRLCEPGASGHAQRLRCPYHAWTYALDGTLLGAPQMRDGAYFDYRDWGLHRAAVEVWHGLIFVHLGAEPDASVAAELDRVAPDVAAFSPERLKVAHEVAYTCEANWKLMMENFLECYHCPGTHPELLCAIDLEGQNGANRKNNSTGSPVYEDMVVPTKRGHRTLSIDGELVSQRLLGEPGSARAAVDGAAAGYCIKPTISAAFFHIDHATAYRIRPTACDQSVLTLQWLVHQEAEEGRDYEVERLIHVLDATTRQDVTLVERNFAGVSSSRYLPGPNNPELETAVRGSLTAYLELMGRREQAPVE
jgi:phenylpropionate dioxygenase-like ring-hydroxylating dioxygenase large terminal subunit